MWLHKHGWKYYHSGFEEAYSLLQKFSQNFDNPQGSQDTDIIKSVVARMKKLNKELLEHTTNIAQEIRKEDNLLKKIENNIYEVHLVNKIKNKQPLQSYENELSNEFKIIETLYLQLEKDCANSLAICDKTKINKEWNRELQGEAATIISRLKSIESASLKLAEYLKKVLPQLDEYKEWIKKQEEGTEWMENCVRSWVRTAEDTK